MVRKQNCVILVRETCPFRPFPSVSRAFLHVYFLHFYLAAFCHHPTFFIMRMPLFYLSIGDSFRNVFYQILFTVQKYIFKMTVMFLTSRHISKTKFFLVSHELERYQSTTGLFLRMRRTTKLSNVQIKMEEDFALRYVVSTEIYKIA